MTSRDPLLDVIERYLDAAPRMASDPEEIGKFTLFKGRGAWKYYARPRLGLKEPIGTADLQNVRERQRELSLPETFEWVVQTTPTLGDAASAAGMHTVEYPLMVLDRASFVALTPPAGMALRLLSADDPDLGLAWAVTGVAFAAEGTAVGDQGVAERDAHEASSPASTAEFIGNRIREGWSVAAAAYSDVEPGPVAFGIHQPVGDVSEVVGVATLPSYRRRGLAAALTASLVADAITRGVETIFLSAGSEDVARVYGRIGFRRIGAAGGAEAESAAPDMT
jgi:GNAT superfamily N-acetyltransferase